jgi:hypothetical protein
MKMPSPQDLRNIADSVEFRRLQEAREEIASEIEATAMNGGYEYALIVKKHALTKAYNIVTTELDMQGYYIQKDFDSKNNLVSCLIRWK